MAENLSVKERIERQVLANVGGISGIGTVERWSALGDQTRADLSAVIYAEDESSDDAGQGGDSAVTQNAMLLAVEICHAADADDDNSSLVHNRWLAKLEQKLMADPGLVETGTSEQLALDVRKTGSSAPPGMDNAPEFYTVLIVEIIYLSYRDDPYQGPGITTQTG